MTNHIHLIVDPGDNPDNLALLMKRVAGKQTRYKNTLHKTTGSLWEGRYKSSPINTDNYLLACCRYIELNPVRAKMVEAPSQYQWSSCREKLNMRTAFTFDFDPLYYDLGTTKIERSNRYRTWLDTTIPENEHQFLRESVQRGQLTGDSTFSKHISNLLDQSMEHRGQGRPRKKQI